MPFLIRDCVRCGVKKVQMVLKGYMSISSYDYELFMACSNCFKGSIYVGQPYTDILNQGNVNLETGGKYIADRPETVRPILPEKSADVPIRINELFLQAAACRRYGLNEAAGAMFRKTIDVATKQIFATDSRLVDKEPAAALRNRIVALGQFGVLDQDVVNISDIAIVDGNDAAHDEDPYTGAEAEALEELTSDILDRIFVRPAKIARIRDKQIAAGQRKPEA